MRFADGLLAGSSGCVRTGNEWIELVLVGHRLSVH
jgi:hypothetical protein